MIAQDLALSLSAPLSRPCATHPPPPPPERALTRLTAHLFFTYLIPIIPLILMTDGYVSAWRTRSFPHTMHLANLAQKRVNLERARDGEGEVRWKWESGRTRHTWPGGHMSWVVGRREVS